VNHINRRHIAILKFGQDQALPFTLLQLTFESTVVSIEHGKLRNQTIPAGIVVSLPRETSTRVKKLCAIAQIFSAGQKLLHCRYKVNCSYDIKRCQSCHVQYCSLECKAKDSAYHQSRCQAFAWANGSEKSGITHLPETLANLTRWEKTEGDVYLKLALELRPRAYDASEKAQIVAIQAALPEATQKFCSSEQFFTLVGVIANNSFTVSNGTLILLPLVSVFIKHLSPMRLAGSQIHATKFIAKG
jgi:hypothetical protein